MEKSNASHLNQMIKVGIINDGTNRHYVSPCMI